MPKSHRIVAAVGIPVVILVAGAGLWYRNNNQWPDDGFDVSIRQPAYTSTHPRIAMDRAHNNFHTASGRYSPLAHLLSNDGYRVSELSSAFDAPGALDSIDVLVIANAMGWFIPRGARAARPAFRTEEITALRAWVQKGGSLLLIADHYPMGESAGALSAAFGVEMRGGYLADDRNKEPGVGNPTWITYTGSRGLGDHPIVHGRSGAEQVHRIVAFTGQSLSVPDGATALLANDSTAIDMMRDGRDLPSAGRAQAVALPVGEGRVVVAGEAAMFTAQVTGGGKLRFGINWPHTDDRQFALNVLHWLSRLI